ncbi:30S ribosomal protein S11 [Candidatus Peregrinibacteria bacterium]|nr:30S ribosomal protein S11 [Candidatus Peregrinibacteria bacterium]MBI3815955.1 30S ribosomal protein S11 [Candidatus Peregrinibacteria bacterium]
MPDPTPLLPGDPSTASAPDAAPVPRRKKIKRMLPKARVCIHAGENNTIVTFTDFEGNVLGWSSSGSSGFKGTRKSTPYAGKVAAENAALKVKPYGIESVTVEVKGLGPGREQAIRGLQGTGLNLDAIIDTTPIAHGGCRPTGRRRV